MYKETFLDYFFAVKNLKICNYNTKNTNTITLNETTYVTDTCDELVHSCNNWKDKIFA